MKKTIKLSFWLLMLAGATRTVWSKNLEAKDGWEWTQAMFYELYAELPDDAATAKNVYDSVDKAMGNIPRGMLGGGNLEKAMSDMKAAPHEAAHLLFVELYDSRVDGEIRKTHRNYGGFMYDWADEASAVFCETKACKDNRREQLGNPISLEEYFKMFHPSVGDHVPSEHEAGSNGGGRGRQSGVDVGTLMKDREAVSKFYAQSLAVPEWMRATGGNPFFRYFVKEATANTPIDDILVGWNKLVDQVTRDPAYCRNLGQRKTEIFPKSTRIKSVLFLPGESVSRVPEGFDKFEDSFAKWAKRKFLRHEEKLHFENKKS